MADLNIPVRAWDAVTKAAHGCAKIADAIHAAAPLIVAAELDRLADQWSAEPASPVDPHNTRALLAHRLRARARELRGGAT